MNSQVDKARYFINYLKVDSLYTLAGDESKSVLYPEDKVNLKHIITTLPGVCNYKEYKNANRLTPQSSRKIDIGYRGRPLQYWLGEFGQRKSEIGKFFKNISHELQLNIDIETSEAKRIYGKKWYGFLESAKQLWELRVGSGLIRYGRYYSKRVRSIHFKSSSASFQEVQEKTLYKYQQRTIYTAISPRVFEAAILKTCQILTRGDYSGVIKPDIHYIPINPDFFRL